MPMTKTSNRPKFSGAGAFHKHQFLEGKAHTCTHRHTHTHAFLCSPSRHIEQSQLYYNNRPTTATTPPHIAAIFRLEHYLSGPLRASPPPEKRLKDQLLAPIKPATSAQKKKKRIPWGWRFKGHTLPKQARCSKEVGGQLNPVTSVRCKYDRSFP